MKKRIKILSPLIIFISGIFLLTGCEKTLENKEETSIFSETSSVIEETSEEKFEENKDYVISESFIDGLVTVVKYKGDEVRVRVPEKINGKTITEIGAECFKDNKTVEKITLPETITSIEHSAFKNCKNLEEIILPQELSWFGHSVFEGCESLYEITIPTNVVKIWDKAFFGCKNLVKVVVPKSVIAIDKNAFDNCPNVTICTQKDSVVYHYAIEKQIPYIIE